MSKTRLLRGYRQVSILLTFFFAFSALYGQELSNIGLSIKEGLKVETFITDSGKRYQAIDSLPAFSFRLNGKSFESLDRETGLLENRFIQNYPENLFVTFTSFGGGHPSWAGEVTFENRGLDTIVISNIIPFGQRSAEVVITGDGAESLTRAFLIRKGQVPVKVIMPDNAWEAGYSDIRLSDSISVCSIARRKSLSKGKDKRYESLVAPGGKLIYTLYGEFYSGEWQDGLKRIFRDRLIYDIPVEFNQTLYNRTDLKWIRSSYLSILMFAWDNNFYDRSLSRYTFPSLIERINTEFGFADIYGIWPTWPRLGLDQRNQWDLYRDLPGGTTQLRNFARMTRLYGSRFFIAYNPWDNDTRREDHLRGMSGLIKEVEADGVILDTRGNSAPEYQYAADTVRPGVIMYSEGMAVPRDMESIVAGRVHNAIYLSPELNLNKLIKPDFAIFRVADIGEDIIHREIAIAIFNGYGTELNMFRPGRRDHTLSDDLRFLSTTTFILRQNSDAFLDYNWTPLVETGNNNILVNRWVNGKKTIYTILGISSLGYHGAVPAAVPDGYHAISLIHHTEVISSYRGKTAINVSVEGWPQSYSGTRKEGSIDVVGVFPKILDAGRVGDSLKISTSEQGEVLLWDGNPCYTSQNITLTIKGDTTIYIKSLLKVHTDRIVVQFIKDGFLEDEFIVSPAGKNPWLVSKVQRTSGAKGREPKMVVVPGAGIKMSVTGSDSFIPYPLRNANTTTKVDSFLIDIYPVSNIEYYEFLMATQYVPRDTTNWLRHWVNGLYKNGQENYPVVYISIEDAEAYAKWARKRLPTEAEWQLAAQGTDGRKWPWGNDFHGTKCNNSFNRPTPVNAFPKGNSPYGVADMVGNIWQLTGDRYSNGIHEFVIIRGGSYFNPESSWWYIPGGPQSLDKTQMLLLVSTSFDRSETVGFRCVKDISRD